MTLGAARTQDFLLIASPSLWRSFPTAVQTRRSWIERFDSRRSTSMALDRIAIDAALGAGVVGADVAALGAEAAGAIALLAREDSAARDVRKTLCIDAARGLR